MKQENKTMTLMEMIIVVVIIGILSMAGVVGYRATVVRAREREGQAMLRLIAHAEEVLRVETNRFVACAGTVQCNNVLRLNLPNQNPANWNYSVVQVVNVANPPAAVSYCTQAVATANNAGARTFHIRRNVPAGTDESNNMPELPAGGC
ncbi:MAG: prepilin-type N-terminal cleavage/methylation domain-containing protein [Candidatus Omnitrophica bacterium]|nr:prepilin-type N-terminal cleavage/methylation domain-containing protein [Candidatus Omnitrophota bacterium]